MEDYAETNILRRATDSFSSWPIPAQVLVFLLPLMLWIPGYFSIELIREYSCWQERHSKGNLVAVEASYLTIYHRRCLAQRCLRGTCRRTPFTNFCLQLILESLDISSSTSMQKISTIIHLSFISSVFTAHFLN
jgi:hypothetical protein